MSDIKINALKKSIPTAVGERIKYFRLQKNLTQVELAKRTQKDRQYIYKIEKGIVTPNITTIAILAFALDITLQKLFETL
ncbi:MAG: helix-turn-helix domain-containing protein [Flavobacteriaceae bacterium]|nr:helix-turn-helix domain-containing protein [Flavobacteriaceae bacterium]